MSERIEDRRGFLSSASAMAVGAAAGVAMAPVAAAAKGQPAPREEVDSIVERVGGWDNVMAVFVCRKDRVQPYCWLAGDRGPDARPYLQAGQVLQLDDRLSNLLAVCGFADPTSDGRPSGAQVTKVFDGLA